MDAPVENGATRTRGRPAGRGSSTGDASGRRVRRLALAAVVLAGAALRLLHLDQPIRYDEAVTYLRYVTLPLPEALATYDLPNNHVFHTVLARLSTRLLGDTVPALRLPAWLAGTLVVPATYMAGRAARGPRTGLLAAALAAASPVLVLFSVNARGYSLVVLAFLVMVVAAETLMRRRSRAAWAAFVAAAALGAWTIPVMLYPAAAAGAWWFVGAARGGRRPGPALGSIAAAGAAAAALAALFYLPVIREAGLEALTANRFVTPRPLEVFAAALPGFLAGVVREWTHGVPVWVSGLVAAGATAECVVWLRGRRGLPPPLFPVAAAAALLVLAASRRAPFARVWLFLLPAALILGASGLVRLADDVVRRALPEGGRRRVAGRGVAALALVGALSLGGVVHGSDTVRAWGLTGSLPAGDRVADFLAERWERGDAVRARIPSDAPLEFYLRRRGLPPSVVNGTPDPGGCVYVVVNRRHGQSLTDLIGGRSEGARGPADLLRRWGETVVYGLPPVRGTGLGPPSSGCRRTPDAS